MTMMHEIGGPTMWMGSAVAVASTKVAGDGSWTLSNIPPGEYRLSIRAAARGNDPAQEGQVTINVAGVDVEGLSLVAGAGGTVRGEVVTDDGSPLPAGFDRMQVRPPFNPNARMMISVLHPDNGRVQSDGSFEVQGVLSDTVLSIGPLTGEWTLKAIEVEGRDMADLPLPIEHGKTLSGVRVVLTSRPTTIRGALRDEKQNPAEGTVIVFAEDSAKWRDGSRVIRATRPDQRGLFTFKGLPAGDYLLVALDYVQEGQWNDPEFLDGLKGARQSASRSPTRSRSKSISCSGNSMRLSTKPPMSWILAVLVTAATTAVALRSSAAQVPAPPPMQPAQPRDAAPAAKGTAAILGRVTNLETGGPLRRALIRITSPALPSDRRVSTNSDGRYEVRDLPAGEYSLKAERGGYLTLAYGQRRPGEVGKPLQLGEGQTAEGNRFRPPTHGSDQRTRRRRNRRADRKGQRMGDAVRPPSRRTQAHPVHRPGRRPLARRPCADGRERAVFAACSRQASSWSWDRVARRGRSSRIRRRCSATRHRSIRESSSQPKRSA